LENDTVIITEEGKPVITATSYEQFESLVETIEILSNLEFANRLVESIAQAKRGEVIGWEEAK
jgi:PHD/YefM family antitoxin component YafN of YafNO toxin-antitoxin module